jgi:hypothetical protein
MDTMAGMPETVGVFGAKIEAIQVKFLSTLPFVFGCNDL